VTDEIRAAGAVVRHPAEPSARVLLVHRPKYDDWSLPKGKLEPGEHVLQAAVREVAEETGLRVTLGRRLPPAHYLASGTPKRVDYWVAMPEGLPAEFVPNREVDGLAWATPAAAGPAGRAGPEAASPAPAGQGTPGRGVALSYERDVETVAAALSGPRQTTPLIMLRHASAGHRSDWPGDDLSRPLDPQGELDARLLASLLRCFGVSRVVSAPAERCQATVRPYAAATGVGIEVEPAFDAAKADGNGTVARGVGAGAEKAAAALAVTDEPVIICAHRENLPVLLAAACAQLGAHPPVRRPLRKGEFLVLHRAAGRAIAVERYHPEVH
jgi:8-oxo-dGTP diphosphatase